MTARSKIGGSVKRRRRRRRPMCSDDGDDRATATPTPDVQRRWLREREPPVHVAVVAPPIHVAVVAAHPASPSPCRRRRRRRCTSVVAVAVAASRCRRSWISPSSSAAGWVLIAPPRSRSHRRCTSGVAVVAAHPSPSPSSLHVAVAVAISSAAGLGGLLSWLVGWLSWMAELNELDEVSTVDWLGCNTQHVLNVAPGAGLGANFGSRGAKSSRRRSLPRLPPAMATTSTAKISTPIEEETSP
ncbi:hypothetical protein LWI29_001026 [Acer saccharum]|uniref:Uncharacterized protein n=1 Tax=Acer saccharum TaxID=4024 RepID=A0AA39SN10_ACESA|nr:hypothetical protein LWI29_001026 [Acer saccharum]